MNKIEIIFYILASFFEVGNPRIAAENTTITIFPDKKEILINQKNLFAIIQSSEDKENVIKEWNIITNPKNNKLQWSALLKNYSKKKLSVSFKNDEIQTEITLKYDNFKDLEVLGIWYNQNENIFSINHIPELNITTNDGKLIGNYWQFSADQQFNFSMKSNFNLPERYQDFKTPLINILNQD